MYFQILVINNVINNIRFDKKSLILYNNKYSINLRYFYDKYLLKLALFEEYRVI